MGILMDSNNTWVEGAFPYPLDLLSQMVLKWVTNFGLKSESKNWIIMIDDLCPNNPAP